MINSLLGTSERAKVWAQQTGMGWKDVNLQSGEVETNFPPIFGNKRKIGMLDGHIRGWRTEPGKMPSSSNVTVPVARQQSRKASYSHCTMQQPNIDSWKLSSKPSTAPKFFYNKTPRHSLAESSEALRSTSLLELSAPGLQSSPSHQEHCKGHNCHSLIWTQLKHKWHWAYWASQSVESVLGLCIMARTPTFIIAEKMEKNTQDWKTLLFDSYTNCHFRNLE